MRNPTKFVTFLRLFATFVLMSLSMALAASGQEGALVQVQMKSTVGLLLDEVPSGALREAAALTALKSEDDFWIEKAQRQIRLADYRLVFRSAYYTDARGPLPLPSKTVWDLRLHGKSHRQQIGGHDYVAIDYTFQTVLVSDPNSPGTAEPALSLIGGKWSEPLVFPVDPDLLFERTGYACMDEFAFPPGSVFEENTWYYFDQTCAVETPATSVCHITQFPQESCTDSLKNHVGSISPNMNFKRIDYDRSIADQFRVGTIVNPTGADLAVVEDQLAGEQAVLYRYFEPASCEVAEGSVGAPGWRRLLAFSAVVRNDGVQPIHMGDPTDPNNPWVQGHAFTFSQCHQHYHFTHYGAFRYGNQPCSKKAFCLEDTNRYHNDEVTPLTAIHQTCTNQGIGAGWGDEYNFGTSGQWVDITNVDTSHPQPLTFLTNPDSFLCEGQTLDANGNPVDPLDLGQIAFLPSGFNDPNGNQVLRNRCAFYGNWKANNLGSVQFSQPTGSFVTQPCTRGQIGPLRDCGFDAESDLQACDPGQPVKLLCKNDEGASVLRACEMSSQLGAGVACSYRDSLSNTIVGKKGVNVRFSCPAVRDATNGDGGFSLYRAPLLSDHDEGEAFRCVRH